MRREFIIVKKLICILLLAALLLAPTAFAKGCKHENTELRNAETGTCCEPGYSGDLYCLDCSTVLIPGHATENGPHMLYEEPKGYRESTCTMHGFAGNFYCSECGGLIVKGEILPMLEHVPGSTGEAEEPDCDDEGCTAYTNCLHCYQTFEGREPIPALGHDFSEVYETVEATCRSEGFISGYCARCEYDREEDIAQLEHDYVDNVCTGCGYYLPGLYDNDGNLVKTWEQLCEDGDIYFEKYRDYGEYRIEYESVYLGLTGQLVLPDDADLYSRLLAGSQLTSLWFGQNADYIYELSDCPNLEKIVLPWEGLEDAIKQLLEDIHANMFEMAKKYRDEKIYEASNFDEFVKNVEEGQGFVRAPWCDETACELEIKEKTGITTRCMPLFEDFDVTGCTCVHCGKPAKKIMYFGKSY